MPFLNLKSQQKENKKKIWCQMSGVGLMMSGYPMIKSFFGFKDLFLVVCFSLPLLT